MQVVVVVARTAAVITADAVVAAVVAAVAAIRPVEEDTEEDHDAPQVTDPLALKKPPSIGARMIIVAGHVGMTSRPSTTVPIAIANSPAISLHTPVTIRHREQAPRTRSSPSGRDDVGGTTRIKKK
jgi:hypothetical protein